MPNIITPELILENVDPPPAVRAFSVWLSQPPRYADPEINKLVEGIRYPWALACFRVAKNRGWVFGRIPQSPKNTKDFVQACASVLDTELDAIAALHLDLVALGVEVPETPWAWLEEIWTTREAAGRQFGLSVLFNQDGKPGDRLRAEVQALKGRDIGFFDGDSAEALFCQWLIKRSEQSEKIKVHWSRLWRAWSKVRSTSKNNKGVTFVPRMEKDGALIRNGTGRRKVKTGQISDPKKVLSSLIQSEKGFQDFLSKSFSAPKSG